MHTISLVNVTFVTHARFHLHVNLLNEFHCIWSNSNKHTLNISESSRKERAIAKGNCSNVELRIISVFPSLSQSQTHTRYFHRCSSLILNTNPHFLSSLTCNGKRKMSAYLHRTITRLNHQRKVFTHMRRVQSYSDFHVSNDKQTKGTEEAKCEN